MYEYHFANRGAMIAEARSAVQAGEFSQAEAILKLLLRADPNDSEAASLLASAVARNISEVRYLRAQRSNAFLVGPFGILLSRRFRAPRSVHCWLFAIVFFLIGFAELFQCLPLMLAHGPDAMYTYTAKGGHLASEPVSYAVGEAGVMIFVAVTFAAVAIALRRR